ncbi:Glutathione hydrolase 6 [Bagarius yarrelli]|uniref:Glutathione hydrolase 6 n=1 Tax=Bagarius yarrelli TaxID=175774 RepID=A0A556U868_BAGYA|nr:Glutathione hydrolase 6 [Bagarius yarrelli]
MERCDVRYTKVATDIQYEIEPGRENEDSDEEQVTVYLKLPADRRQEKTRQRLTCFRVSADLLLLAVIVVFALLQWYKYWPDSEGIHNAATHIMNISKEHDDNHHHSTMADDEHDDGEESHHHEHSALYHHAVVLTASANCSSIGKALLQEGGNIVDAAIASLLCLGVVHPHTAGLGGVFSAVLYNKTSGLLKTICSAAPENSSTTILVPSILQGLHELHSRWGRSKWSRLFKEAITLAQEGFLIDNVLARALKSLKEKILTSKLCDLFCDATGHVKSVGAIVQNKNLSKLLQSASLNENNFLETLAVKLSEDLSLSERPGFLAAIQHSRGEINDSVIVEGDKYSVLSASFPFSGQILSDILKQVRQRSLSFKDGANFNRTSTAYGELLNLIQVRNNSAFAQKYPGLKDTFISNIQNSHVAVLDQSGNFLIMSASLNSTWGSGRFLPSSGIILNSFNANLLNSPHFNLPLVLRISEEDESHNDDTGIDEEENEVEVVAVFGGLSTVFNAAVLLHNRIDLGMSSKETLSIPLLHLEPGMSSAAFCLSGIVNDSDVYMRFSEVGHELQQVDECSDYSLATILRLHTKHIGAYGAPAVYAQKNGY